MKKILLVLTILLASKLTIAKGFDFEGYKRYKNAAPKLPTMYYFLDYENHIWDVSLNENAELVIVIALENHTLSKTDALKIKKFLNDNLDDVKPKTEETLKVRVLKQFKALGKSDVVVEEKFFHKGP